MVTKLYLKGKQQRLVNHLFESGCKEHVPNDAICCFVDRFLLGRLITLMDVLLSFAVIDSLT